MDDKTRNGYQLYNQLVNNYDPNNSNLSTILSFIKKLLHTCTGEARLLLQCQDLSHS